jgi:hypothetical protein
MPAGGAIRRASPTMLSDNQLLALNASALQASELPEALRLLEQHGDVFRAQLVAAHWLENYLKQRKRRSEEAAWPRLPNDERDAGYEAAVRDVIMHLRQGDFLPGGALYEDELARG